MCTICSLTIEFSVEHPLALAVAMATRQAIEGGSLPGAAAQDMDMQQSRHHAITLLTGLQQRLEQVLSPSRLMALPTFYVLMIESRTWGYFQPTRSGFDQQANPLPPRLEPDENGTRDAAIVTSQAAAMELVAGKLSFEHALADGLIVVDARDPAAVTISAALEACYPATQFSHFVCAEMA